MKYTYLFHNPVDGLTKIGKTKSPARRFANICASAKSDLIAKAVFIGDFEIELHRKFSDYRKTGEWFDLDHSILSDFEQSDDNRAKESIPVGYVNDPGTRSVSIQIGPELLQDLTEIAKMEGRTLSGQIRVFLGRTVNTYFANKEGAK